MKSYYLSENEYNKVFKLVRSNFSNVIRYQGLLIQWYKEDDQDILVCAYEKAILSGKYEWYFIPNPADYR